VAALLGVPSHLIDDASELQAEWLQDKRRVGLTAGASAPDILVQGVIARLRELGAISVRSLEGEPETMKFPLPKGLKKED
jgi:4-hydroxy-3-methylbut-2-enyl diphosphate reductase